LEELLPKDNETMPHPLDGPLSRSELKGFTADQMIRCDECLRANPPTRVSCLYCNAALPLNETSAKLRRPSLRQPEKHEPGFNCLFVPQKELNISSDQFEDVAQFLKLSISDVQGLVETNTPMPLARTASAEEAQLVLERLREIGIETICLSDEELGLQPQNLIRPRSLQIEDEALVLNYSAGTNVVYVPWPDVFLMVVGRLLMSTVEIKERMTRGSENDLIDTSQFSSDESVFDLYSTSEPFAWRIGANSFDFSCLGDQKTLIAGHNLNTLRRLIITKAIRLHIDDSFDNLRRNLQHVWPLEQQMQSGGWRRERPGKFSLEATTLNSNETQFSRYSRLRWYFVRNGLS
jgi:hypothetical protein